MGCQDGRGKWWALRRPSGEGTPWQETGEAMPAREPEPRGITATLMGRLRGEKQTTQERESTEPGGGQA